MIAYVSWVQQHSFTCFTCKPLPNSDIPTSALELNTQSRSYSLRTTGIFQAQKYLFITLAFFPELFLSCSLSPLSPPSPLSPLSSLPAFGIWTHVSLSIHLCRSREQKRVPPALLHCSAYSFELGSVSNPGAKLAAKPGESPVSGVIDGWRNHACFICLF